MPFITNKPNFERFAEIIRLMPGNDEFVIDFDKAVIYNLAGEQVAEFSPNLFQNAHNDEMDISYPKYTSLQK